MLFLYISFFGLIIICRKYGFLLIYSHLFSRKKIMIFDENDICTWPCFGNGQDSPADHLLAKYVNGFR